MPTTAMIDLPMISVEICIMKASMLYGHSADQVRAAQPRTSAVDSGRVSFVVEVYGRMANGAYLSIRH